MKIELHEYDGAFSFEVTAETLEDAVLLARLAMNHKKQSVCIACSAHSNKSMSGYVSIGKRKDYTSYIGRVK